MVFSMNDFKNKKRWQNKKVKKRKKRALNKKVKTFLHLWFDCVHSLLVRAPANKRCPQCDVPSTDRSTLSVVTYMTPIPEVFAVDVVMGEHTENFYRVVTRHLIFEFGFHIWLNSQVPFHCLSHFGLKSLHLHCIRFRQQRKNDTSIHKNSGPFDL